jgi:hypothetical protein
MAKQREESQGFYEMLWDCEYCDARGLLGKTQRYCANCGAAQNPDKRYFPKEGEQRRVDGHSYEGADRQCPACSAPQSAKAHNCTHCGAVLDGAAEVRGFTAQADPKSRPEPRRRRRRIWPIVLAVLAVLIFGIWWQCIRTRSATVTVASHSWQRVVAVEEFNQYQEESWRNQVPVEATFPICSQRKRSTRQVPDGEDCTMEKRDKKDGTFEQVRKCTPRYRSEPVMDDWCRYQVRRWKKVGEVKASGKDMTPAWPGDLPPENPATALGAKRQGPRTETLTLDFGGSTCDVSDAIWRKYSDGQKIKVEVRASSGDVVCGSL